MFERFAHVLLFLGALSIFGMAVLLASIAVELIDDGRYVSAALSAIASTGVMAAGTIIATSFFRKGKR